MKAMSRSPSSEAIMKVPEDKTPLARRQVLGASVAGAALLILPEACSSSSDDTVTDASTDVHKDVTTGDVTMDTAPPPIDAPEEPDATLVDAGGSCKQDDWTRPISIMKAGIAMKGTAFAFTDERFTDTAWFHDRILVINPLTGSGYVAMSGVCTHRGCCPQYFPKCLYNTSTQVCTEASVPDAGIEASAEGGSEAGNGDAGGDAGTEILTDVLWCNCHQSVFSALDGSNISGPAFSMGPLQLFQTPCVGGGYVFVTIPDNGFGAGTDTGCGSIYEGHEP
jgi:Rieske Fe-S protein